MTNPQINSSESVDDDKRELDIFEEYSHYFCEFTPEKDNEQRCRWCGELEDEGRHTMKKAIEAYYTRECARKVLEAKVEQTELIRDEWGKWLAFPDDDPHEKTEIRHIVTHCNELIAELRAAIQEVGGGE